MMMRCWQNGVEHVRVATHQMHRDTCMPPAPPHNLLDDVADAGPLACCWELRWELLLWILRVVALRLL
jgi:hypothetical protein